MKQTNGKRAPGPDGFNLDFVKANWEVIKEDYIQFLLDFHGSGKLPQGMNSSFIPRYEFFFYCPHP